MNGLLTALLGGAAGVGQGLQGQDERERELAKLKLAQDAQAMERDKMRASFLLEGLEPDDGRPPQQPTGPIGQAPQPPQPSGPSLAPAPYTPSTYGNAGPRDMMPTGAPPAPPPLTLPGGVPAVDVMRSVAGQGAQPPGFSLADYMNRSGSVDMPSMGGKYRFNFANSQIGRQAMLEQYKIQQQSAAHIYEAYATGQMDKTAAETALARLNADPRFAGAKAGAEESAKYPYQAGLSDRNFGHQQALQSNQQNFTHGENVQRQGFEQGQQGRAQTFEQGLRGQELAGQFANTIGADQYREGGAPMARATRYLSGGQAPTVAPSSQFFAPQAPVAAQPGAPQPGGQAPITLNDLRAKYDASYNALKMRKLSDGAIVNQIGTRP